MSEGRPIETTSPPPAEEEEEGEGETAEVRAAAALISAAALDAAVSSLTTPSTTTTTNPAPELDHPSASSSVSIPHVTVTAAAVTREPSSSDSEEEEPTENQPLLLQNNDQSVAVAKNNNDDDDDDDDPLDSSTVPLLGEVTPSSTPEPREEDFVEISPVLRVDHDSKIVAAPPQTPPPALIELCIREDSDLPSFAEPPNSDAPSSSTPPTPTSPADDPSTEVALTEIDISITPVDQLNSETSSTPEKYPLIDAQDDTPQSSPLADSPQSSTPNKLQDHTALTIVDLSIAEAPDHRVEDSSTPASVAEPKKKKLDTLKKNFKTGTESLKRGSESVGNTLKRQSSQVGSTLKKSGSQVGTSLKKGGEQVGSSLKKGGEQVGSTLRRGTLTLRENISQVNLPKPDIEAAKARIAKAKPKSERNEHYCNCLRGIMLMSIDDLKSPLFWRAAMAEFVGTMILTMVGCGSCIGYSPGTDLVRIALGFGLIVATVIWGIGHVSGGHVNPAVTLAMAATRKISAARAALYIIMQLCGAVIGAGILKGLTPEGLGSSLGATSLAKGVVTFPNNVSSDYAINPGQGFGIEFFITFVLVFVVFATCDNKRNDHGGSNALAIGLAVAVCHLWAVPATGASMNTARSFGPAVVAGVWDDHWIYWVGPLLGGVTAGFVYDHVFAQNSSKQKFRTCMLGAEYQGDDFDAVLEKPRKIVESEDDIVESKAEV